MKKQQKNDETAHDEATEPEANESANEPGNENAMSGEGERAQLDAKLRRAMADLANIRKRQAKELEDARRRAIEALTAELLPVLDNFHLALALPDNAEFELHDDARAMLDGLVMVRSLLEGTLERHGLSEIPSDGAAFDPNLHEAVGVDTESNADAGTITKVMQRGYKIGDKVLRASRVVVAGAPDQASDSDGSEAED